MRVWLSADRTELWQPPTVPAIRVPVCLHQPPGEGRLPGQGLELGQQLLCLHLPPPPLPHLPKQPDVEEPRSDMGAEHTKQELEVGAEPITYFAINIKQPDKLHIVPSDSVISSLVTRALETHYR